MRDLEIGGASSDVQPQAERFPRYIVVAAGIAIIGILLFATAVFLARRAASPAPEVSLAHTGSVIAAATSSASPVATTTSSPLVTSGLGQSVSPVAATKEGMVAGTPASTVTTPIATLPADEGHITAHPASSQLELNVQAAYLHYWEVRAEALNSLDPSRLQDVEAGPELARDSKQIEDLRSQGRALVIDVTHHVFITRASSTLSEVYDQYDNHGYVIDATTKLRLGSPEPSAQVKTLRLLQSFDGLWKVTDAKIVQ